MQSQVEIRNRYLISPAQNINRGGIILADLIRELRLWKRLKSIDGTEKFIWQTNDGKYFEAVVVDLEYRNVPRVICVSSQIGCPVRCQFCNTGKYYDRNLSANEIVHQVTYPQTTSSYQSKQIDRFEVSFMAMGEPLLNWENVKHALDQLSRIYGSRLDVTISTVGIVPKIYELGVCSFAFPVDLQISLHSADENQRTAMIDCGYRLKEIIDAGVWYSNITGRKVCINYLLMDRFNDSIDDCANLISILDPDHFYVKLSQLNPIGKRVKGASRQVTDYFEHQLQSAGFCTKIFVSKGVDIGAGCGQLPLESDLSINQDLIRSSNRRIIDVSVR
jgi:23S rRNA (adenine2503-C2)-methyltransferase